MKPSKPREVTCGDTPGGWPASLQWLHPSPPLAEQRMASLPAADPDSASRATIRSLTVNMFFLGQAGGWEEPLFKDQTVTPGSGSRGRVVATS